MSQIPALNVPWEENQPNDNLDTMGVEDSEEDAAILRLTSKKYADESVAKGEDVYPLCHF